MTLRKLLFWICAVFYLLACPLLILYALGYLFKPGEDKLLVRTGLIYLATAPSGASITLNDKLSNLKTPAVLSNLEPGEYRVHLEREGYRPWNDTLPVEAEKATVFEKILLLPDSWAPEKILSGPWDGLEFFEGPPLQILLSRGKNPKESVSYDIKRGSVLASEEVLPGDAGELWGIDVFTKWNRPGKLLLWQKDRIGFVDFSDRRPKPKSVHRKGREIRKAFWVYEGTHVLFQDRDEIFFMDLETLSKPRSLKVAETRLETSGYYSEDTGKLYFLDREGSFMSLDFLPKRELIPLGFPERKEEKIRGEWEDT